MIIFDKITLKRGTNVLLEQASATINPQQKVALIGKNGCGKSSLFLLILAKLGLDAGTIKIPQNWQIAWVKQETPAVELTIVDYVMQGDVEYCQLQQELASALQQGDETKITEIYSKLELIDAWTMQSRVATLLHGLGFHQEQLTKSVAEFSGGWRMRLNLAQALICRSDLLLLDEPTNHLDLDAVIWLEKWLTRYTGTMILISHDRYFIDKVATKIIHIEQQQLNEYTGNYSNFERMRAAKLEQQASLYKAQQQKIEHLQSFISRFKAKASKAKQAQSRVKQLERMTLISNAHLDSPFTFSFRAPEQLPSPILTMQEVSCGYANTTILKTIKLNLVPGSRIGLLGKNGAGKSTLVKLLADEIQPQTGKLTRAKGLKLGYFAQHQTENLRINEHALWHLQHLDNKVTEQEARSYLGSFDFTGDKVYQGINSFSGGEKARLVLALIIWQKPNLLLLDEPTNHLDLEMRQALTEALVEYEGSLIVVSHDRHLLENTVNEFYLVDQQRVTEFDGDLNDYYTWLQNTNKPVVAESKTELQSDTELQDNNFLQRKQQKKVAAELRQKSAPLREQLKKLDKQIAKLSQELTTIEEVLSSADIYQAEQKDKLNQTLTQQLALKQQLAILEEQWFEIQTELEEFTG